MFLLHDEVNRELVRCFQVRGGNVELWICYARIGVLLAMFWRQFHVDCHKLHRMCLSSWWKLFYLWGIGRWLSFTRVLRGWFLIFVGWVPFMTLWRWTSCGFGWWSLKFLDLWFCRWRQFFINFLFWLSLIHIWRCRRYAVCRSRWSPYH